MKYLAPFTFALLASLLGAAALLAAPAGLAAAPPAEAPADATGGAETRVEPPAATPRALEYYAGNNRIYLLNLGLAFVLPLLFVFTGLSARLRDFCERITRPWPLALLLFLAIYAAAGALLYTPLEYFTDHLRQKAFGLSNQDAAQWLGDQAKALAVGLILGAPLAWGVYWIMRKSPQRYWLYLSALSFPLALFMILIQPALIAPLFDDFGPLQNRALETRILDLAGRAGIEGARVYEVNKSADTNALNAYVTGVLGTKRIVLWDTLLARLDEREVLFVMGHEMGHYVLQHVVITTALVSLATLLAFFAGDRLARALMGRAGRRTRIRGLTDPAALPLLLVVLEALSLFGQPALRAWSRSIERDADQFGLEITRDNHACATAFLKLSETNLANPRPGPIFVFFRASHPPLAERVEYCNDYRPWETGAPLRFKEHFRAE